jgi:hypothetical protein
LTPSFQNELFCTHLIHESLHSSSNTYFIKTKLFSEEQNLWSASSCFLLLLDTAFVLNPYTFFYDLSLNSLNPGFFTLA